MKAEIIRIQKQKKNKNRKNEKGNTLNFLK